MILADHQAAREIFAVTGNSVFEGYAERADEFERFRTLWRAHDAMMEEAVFPILAEVAQHTESLDRIRTRQRDLREMIATLAHDAADPSHTNDHWFEGFERLRRLFDAQAAEEQMLIVGMIRHDLSADQIARMSDAAQRIRG